MNVVHVEISGPVLASFHHKFAESHGDFSAILLGSVTVTDYSENTDLATMTEKSMTRVVVKKWVVLNVVEDLIDLKTGMLELKTMKLLEEKHKLKILGMLKFKKSMKMVLPSFLDRKVMSALLKYSSSRRPCLYMTVGEEVTTNTLSIKHSMVTYLLDQDGSVATRKIPLLVPNLGTDQMAEYSRGVRSESLEELLMGYNLDNCVVDVNRNFQPLNTRFKACVEDLSGRITELDRARARLEEEVMKLSQAVNKRQEQTCMMKLIKGLQGDLKAALDVGVGKSDVKHKVEEKMNSLKLVLSDDEDFMS